MRTVITSTRNGVQIVEGFGMPVVDPAKTCVEADKAVRETDTYKEVCKLVESKDVDRERHIKLCEDLQAHYDRIRNENPIFCHPKQGEEIIDQREFEMLACIFQSLKPGQILTRDGDTMNAVDLMTEEEKQQRRANLMTEAERSALEFRSIAEIRGDCNPLQASREFYLKRKSEIEAIYGE